MLSNEIKDKSEMDEFEKMNISWTVKDICKAEMPESHRKQHLESLMIRACSNGDYKTVKECLCSDTELNINALDDTRTPSLIYACCFGHLDILQLLLDHGADVNIQDSKGWTPLMWTKTNGFNKGEELLQQVGAASHTKTLSGKTIDDLSKAFDTTSNSGDIDQEFVELFQESTKFDWDVCKPSQMFVFEESMMDRILDIAISRVIPSKSNFVPVGANVLFLSCRYACHYHSIDMTIQFLARAFEKIETWIKDSNDIFTYIYWLANCFQLQVYLKRDTTLLISTIETQVRLADVMNQIFDLLLEKVTVQVKKDSQAIIEHGVDKDIRFDVEFFGIGGRKTVLKQSQSSSGFLNRLFEYQSTAIENLGPQNITNTLTDLMNSCISCNLNPQITLQVFQAIFHQLDKHIFDQLLQNRLLCCRSRAQQIQLNISIVQDWIRENRGLKTQQINVANLLEQFRPVIGLLQFLQIATTLRSVSEFREVIKSFGLPVQVIHHVMCQYRFESSEQSFLNAVEVYIENEFEASPAQPYEEQLTSYHLNIPLNQSNYDEWKTIPHIPQIVIDMMDS
jgi:hypothetical protein